MPLPRGYTCSDDPIAQLEEQHGTKESEIVHQLPVKPKDSNNLPPESIDNCKLIILECLRIAKEEKAKLAQEEGEISNELKTVAGKISLTEEADSVTGNKKIS